MMTLKIFRYEQALSERAVELINEINKQLSENHFQNMSFNQWLEKGMGLLEFSYLKEFSERPKSAGSLYP